ncbi:hypothetical protein ABK040_000952 [Willaertia magna]
MSSSTSLANNLPKRRPILFLIGDSITEFSLTTENGYHLELLKWYGSKVDIINRGFSGYTTRLILDLISNHFHKLFFLSSLNSTKEEENKEEEQEILITICLGSNDASTSNQHVPIDEYKLNLIKIINLLKNNFKEILKNLKLTFLLITPPPVNTKMYDSHCLKTFGTKGFRENETFCKYAEKVREIVKEEEKENNNLYLVDLWKNEWTNECYSDGLHLSNVGYQLFFKSLQKTIIDHVPSFDPNKMSFSHFYWRDAIDQYNNKYNINNN